MRLALREWERMDRGQERVVAAFGSWRGWLGEQFRMGMGMGMGIEWCVLMGD